MGSSAAVSATNALAVYSSAGREFMQLTAPGAAPLSTHTSPTNIATGAQEPHPTCTAVGARGDADGVTDGVGVNEGVSVGDGVGDGDGSLVGVIVGVVERVKGDGVAVSPSASRGGTLGHGSSEDGRGALAAGEGLTPGIPFTTTAHLSANTPPTPASDESTTT